jgi:hypothetical protein
MKEDLFKAPLEWPNPHLKREPFYLLLDCCSAHWTMDAKALAVQLETTFHCIHAGGTDYFQPLDVLIFGALKSTAGRLGSQWILNRPGDHATKPEAVQIFIWAWTQLQDETIEEP